MQNIRHGSTTRSLFVLASLTSVIAGACDGWLLGSRASDSATSSSPELRRHKVRVSGAESLVGHRADIAPYNLIGILSRRSAAGQRSALCTCIKAINDSTCLAAAHCFMTCGAPPTLDPALNRNGWATDWPEITFRPDGVALRPAIAAGDYGVAVPRVYWDGCLSGDRLKQKTNDIAVIRFSGAYDAMLNNFDTVHQGAVSPAIDGHRYRVGFVGIRNMGLPLPGGCPSCPGDLWATVVGYPDVDDMPAEYRPEYVVFGPYPVLLSGHGLFRLRAATPALMDYAATTFAGMSGSPVFTWDPAGPDDTRLSAIHLGDPVVGEVPLGAGDPRPATHNRGVLLTPDLLAKLSRRAGGP